MRNFLSFIVLTLLFSCKNPNVTESFYPNGSLLERDEKINKNVYKIDIFYENGKLLRTGYGIDGHFEGIVKTFDESGKISIIASYKYGKYNGLVQYFLPNGEIESCKYYLNDSLFYVKQYKKNKIDKVFAIPLISKKIESNKKGTVIISMPFIDSLDYYDKQINVKYKFFKDSTIWDIEKKDGEFSLSNSKNTFQIKFYPYKYSFIETISSVSDNEILGYFNIKRIKEK